jgi:hypothetical protein
VFICVICGLLCFERLKSDVVEISMSVERSLDQFGEQSLTLIDLQLEGACHDRPGGRE